ncbi:MAG: hypothetical protein ACO23R_15620, partial [bacterium]
FSKNRSKPLLQGCVDTYAPREKAKKLRTASHQKIKFVNKINLLKTLAHFGRGGTVVDGG